MGKHLRGESGPALCARCERQNINALGISSLVGALFVYVFLSFVAPSEVPTRSVRGWQDVAFFLGFVAVSGFLVSRKSITLGRRATQWLIEDREPTPVEGVATLQLPLTLALIAFAAWVAAAIFFGALTSVTHTAIRVATVSLTILDGGLVSCTIGFLLSERAQRPTIARLLAAQGESVPRTLGVRSRLLLTWALGSGVFFAGLALLPIASRTATVRADISVAVVTMSVAGLLFGAAVMLMAAKSVSEPLDSVRAALARIGTGDLDVEIDVDDAGEIGMLQRGVNQMAAGLRERERLADLFGRHVGHDVAQLALAQGTGLESEQREASVLFVDLIGSTAMAEVLAPAAVVETLNAFFATVVRVVAAEGGWVNKFEGDGALCVFGAPAQQADHAARALRAARALHGELVRLGATHPGLEAAIGVSAGPLVAGNVGTESRYEYTVIGRPVNEAARLTDLAKGRPGRVLAGAGALDRAGDEARRWASLGAVALRGQQAPAAIYAPAASVPVDSFSTQ
jgi:adenylate cyclase